MDHGRRIGALGWAVGIPLAAVALTVTGELLTTHGPPMFAGTAPGKVLVVVIGFAAFAIVTFSQIRYPNLIVFFGAFAALCAALLTVGTTIEDGVLRSRGESMTCTVTAIHPITVAVGDSQRIDRVHDLSCPDRTVFATTVRRRLAEPGETVAVVHDPLRRLEPRPADDVGDPVAGALQAAALLAAGIGLRLLCEFGVWPFRPRW